MAASASTTKHFTANLPPPSKLDFSNRADLHQNWSRFKRQWRNYAVASRLKEENKDFQVAVFMTCIGDEGLDVFEGFRMSDEESQNLDQIIQAFETFCVGEVNEVFQSYNFHLRSQKEGESVDAYITDLRQLARKCNFAEEDRMIRDRVVIGLRDDVTRQKLLEQKKLTLSQTVDICRAQEAAKTQTQAMSTSCTVDKLHASNHYSRKHQKPKRYTHEQQGSPGEKKEVIQCGRCGRSHRRGNCPAFGAECYICKKKGHFSNVCRNKRSNQVQLLDDSDTDSETKSFIGTVMTAEGKEDAWNAKVEVNGKWIRFKVDSGADVTAIPSSRIPKETKLTKTDKKLFGAGHAEIKVKGKFSADLKLQTGKATEQEIYVLEGLREPLLGRPAIKALQMFQRINALDEMPPKTTSNGFKKSFPELFTGLGRVSSEYRIQLKEDARPYSVATPRRIALPLQEKVKLELQKLKDDGIIEEIKEPTEWCAPIVVVPKTNDKVRICVDLTKLNENVKRENYPLPTTDHLLAKLSGATVFTKLDCNSGFHQIPLAKESQQLTTFITPFGRFVYKRIPFGISSGPEIFHREMSHLLTGIPGVICNIDDVLISGSNQKEHDERVQQVLQRMREAGMTLNDKCVFSQDRVKFLGHIVSQKGIEIDPEKLEAIKNLPQPNNISDLRRLLGMVNHVGKFVENLTDVTAPLRELLKKENCWIWSHPQETAFRKIKEALCQAPVLAHYSPQLETKVSADASKSGLGGVLFQKHQDTWKPVCYASRSMTNTEARYAQVEKEALGVTWACEKFSDFLVGLKNFKVETDHKPLLALLQKKGLDELTPRIQRFRMRLMRFSYSVEYTCGKNLYTADTLSRAPLQKASDKELRQEEELHSYVDAIMKGLPASKGKLEEIKTKQNEDEVTRTVKTYCQTGWPASSKKNADLKKFWTVRHELALHHGLLLYKSRLVIPKDMQTDIMQRLHEGHQGIAKCRALAKISVWWPGISTQIEQEVTDCPICEKYRKVPPEPLTTTPTPEYPWQRVGMDLFEWKGAQYLLIVDYFSRWIEIALLKNTSSSRVIEHTKSIFARHGIPETVISDNGPQFASCEFSQFSEQYGFEHSTSSPRHPQGNGEAERAVQTIKNLLKKAQDPYIALLNYRTTPLKQGSSPAQLLMGRRLRTKIPAMVSQYKPRWRHLSQFEKADAREKKQQKSCYDQRHRASPLPPFNKGQQVWVKQPNDQEAVVLNKTRREPDQGANERSYLLQTPLGQIRRNRLHLRQRSLHPYREGSVTPDATSLVSTGRQGERAMTTQSAEDSMIEGGLGKTKTSLPMTVSSDTSPPVHHTSMQTQNNYITRSGREIKPPKKYTC